jgi:hypothetical protein
MPRVSGGTVQYSSAGRTRRIDESDAMVRPASLPSCEIADSGEAYPVGKRGSSMACRRRLASSRIAATNQNDCEEGRTLRAVLVGMLRDMERR